MAKPKVAPIVKEEKQGTRRLSCTCHNEFQNRVYGFGIRVMNKTKTAGEYRCTSCGKTRQK